MHGKASATRPTRTAIIMAFSDRIHAIAESTHRAGFQTRMPLRIQLDQPVMRVCGTLMGIGFVMLGVYSVLGAQELGADMRGDRAMGFGVTAIIIGIIAVLCSLLVKDLSNIWCRHPRRWK
jgi:hypothetical protein